MTPIAIAALALLAVVAPLNWWSRWVDDRTTELWTKPLATVLILVAALTADRGSAAVTAWVAVALACSLAGDVALLGGERRFLLGLGSFLLAHVAYLGAFVASPERRWWGALVGVAVATVVAIGVGRPLVRAASRRSPTLGRAVVAYMVVILAMAVGATVAAPPAAVVGAFVFVASDSLLGWDRFVAHARWRSPAVMATYHVGQVLLALPLVLAGH